jgi:hypothetical protein
VTPRKSRARGRRQGDEAVGVEKAQPLHRESSSRRRYCLVSRSERKSLTAGPRVVRTGSKRGIIGREVGRD